MPSRRWIWLAPPVQVVPFRYLLVVPILLAIATALALFVHSDVDIALLWSQCHSRARIPALSRIPALGTPSCFLVSFFQCALDSLRTKAVMSVILAYVGALVTVCTVEAARACNRPNALIVRLTLPWLVFNLVGGAVVWQLVIVPAFMHRARMLSLTSSKRATANTEDDQAASPSDSELHLATEAGRTLPDSEVVAIPIAVAVGYFLPSILMLVYNNPAVIAIWLFFPVYVTLVRKAVRYIIQQVRQNGPTSIHLESHWPCVVLVYALPVALSVLAHIFVIWNFAAGDDDRKKMTRLTVRFIEIDFQFIAWTVLYWVFVEAGWKVPLTMLGASVLGGPGAGTCLGWLYRERLVKKGFGEIEEESGENNQPEEETPLLR